MMDPTKHHTLIRKILIILLLVLLIPAVLAACKPTFLDPPRLVTATARAEWTPPAVTPGPVDLPAPTPTGSSAGAAGTPGSQGSNPNPRLIFWGRQSSDEETAALQTIVSDFSAQHGVNVELFLVEPELLPDLLETAIISDAASIPDVLLMPLEYVAGWAAEGVLDTAVPSAALTALDPATFDQTALDLVRVGDEPAALPSDGWQQLLLYREDWFAQRNLPPPISYTAMISAGQVISDRVSLVAGFNIPTESSLVATTRIFEQMALANGCQIVDEKGELLILEPACREALEFYRRLCNGYCPSGVQTEVSARNSYLSGRAGMIMAPPSILPQLAGLDRAALPTCAECTTPSYLARNTGILTRFSGSGPNAAPTSYGSGTYIGVTQVNGRDNREAATAFLQYWFTSGYETWLAARPAMKVPLRQGTPEEPERYLAVWRALPLTAGGPTLAAIYGEEVVVELSTNVFSHPRWALPQGQGSKGRTSNICPHTRRDIWKSNHGRFTDKPHWFDVRRRIDVSCKETEMLPVFPEYCANR